MAVYERSYRRYEGPLLGGWRTTMALARYTYEDMRRSRILTPVLYGGFLYPLFCLLTIYLRNNVGALNIAGLRPDELISINYNFFYVYMGIQGLVAFVVAALAGPGLIAPDLANRALASILARPITKTSYVLGRMIPLAGILSAITWVPGLALVAVQAVQGESGWLQEYWRVPFAILFGNVIWVGILSLMAMALSAWVRWKPVAGGLMFVIFFMLSAIGGLLNAILDIRWGNLLNLPTLVATVWTWLMEGQPLGDSGFGIFSVYRGQEIPVWMAVTAILLFCGICLRLLSTRIRGTEVIG